VKSLGDLSDQILIDCTNPLGMGRDGLELVLGHARSGGEQVVVWARRAAVFKTFNQTGAENMETASLYPIRPVMFVAGDDEAKKPVVLSLVASLAFEAVDAGPLRNARLLEAYGMLWIDQALYRGGGPELRLRPYGSCQVRGSVSGASKAGSLGKLRSLAAIERR
jgi:8-hydroxy-5-deazaflavin:NADPH oxidoreductase